MQRSLPTLILVLLSTFLAAGCRDNPPPKQRISTVVTTESITTVTPAPDVTPAPAVPTTTTQTKVVTTVNPLVATKENLAGTWEYRRFDGKEYCVAVFTGHQVKLKFKESFFSVDGEYPYAIDQAGKVRISPFPDGMTSRGLAWFGDKGELYITYLNSAQIGSDTSKVRPDFTLRRVKGNP